MMRKRAWRTLAAAVLTGALLVTPAWAETATVTGSGVNLRTAPSMSGQILDCLERDSVVTVLDCSDPQWTAVDFYGTRGFMSSAYLRINGETVPPLPDYGSAPDGQSGAINAMYVRFRTGPGTDYAVLAEYNRGKTLSIVGGVGDWTACIIDGRSGYVHSDYVSYAPVQSVTATAWETVDLYLGTRPPEQTVSEPANEPESETVPEPTNEPTPQESTAAEAPGIPAAEQPLSGMGYIIGDYVRFRMGPSTGYPILGSYNWWKELRVTGVSGDWLQCLIDGQPGYVNGSYVMWFPDTAEEETATEGEAPSEYAPESAETPTETEITEPLTEPETTEPPAGDLTELTQTQSVEPGPAFVPLEGGETEGHITGNNVRMRSGPSMQADILRELFYGNTLTVYGTSGEWTAVGYNGEPGYVYSQYVELGGNGYEEITAEAEGSPLGKQIADYALQFVGQPYVWGGSSPGGFDCSGLVYYVYQQFGYTLNRVAEDQARNGRAVTAAELEPGDVLCFYSGGGYIGHAGIYIGGGQFVHAQNSATGVVVSPLEGYYSSRGYEARRIV